ncbi:MAG TPA: hypothetical protein VKA21_09990 [Candidatus Binatia bacterium]|nr:hypothetical protein [Candidatus Binatia bacterium]
MPRLETVDGGNWREFVAAPVAVLMIGKSDCAACAAWTTELEEFLAGDTEWKNVRFGKMLVDKGGLIEFKRASPWLADVDELPFNQIYVKGERSKSWPGSGVERLTDRLRAVTAAS